MPWFQIQTEDKQCIQYYPSLDEAYLAQFLLKNWQCKIKLIRVTQLNIKELDYFLIEFLKGIEAGLKLQAVLQHMHQGTHSKKTKHVAMALESELMQGVSFNHTFKKLVAKNLHSYCDLFVQKSTPEQLHSNLSIMQQQIHNLRTWTNRLSKSLIYPFFIMQAALLMWLSNAFINSDTDSISMQSLLLYLAISSTQVLIYFTLQSNIAIKIIEYNFVSFRLNKLFCLLNASIAVGNSLQKTLVQLPHNFTHKLIREDLLMVYYRLRLGKSYVESFPAYWFPKESLLALNASCHSGDIGRALINAAQLHDINWRQKLIIIEKIIPIFALIIAASFVSKTLISIYAPLLELP